LEDCSQSLCAGNSKLVVRLLAAVAHDSRTTAVVGLAWRHQPILGRFAYVDLDGIWLKRSWSGVAKNVAVLVAIGVDLDGYTAPAKNDSSAFSEFDWQREHRLCGDPRAV